MIRVIHGREYYPEGRPAQVSDKVSDARVIARTFRTVHEVGRSALSD